MSAFRPFVFPDSVTLRLQVCVCWGGGEGGVKCVCVCVCMRVCVNIFCAHTRTRTHTHAHTHARARAHTHTHTHTHTQVPETATFDAWCSFDGKHAVALKKGWSVNVCTSKYMSVSVSVSVSLCVSVSWEGPVFPLDIFSNISSSKYVYVSDCIHPVN